MIKIYRISVLSLLFILLVYNSPSSRPAEAASAWIEGIYTGWVYFMAKADYSYSMSMPDASIQFDGVRFYESHGTIECNIFDDQGNGHCTASFPLDIINSASGSFTAPDCSATTQVSSRANAVDPGLTMPPLTNIPLDQGFSMKFDPQTGPENGTITVTASGCPGGGTSSYQDTAGQPKWPQLDFHVEYQTALTFGGTCSMEGLPRSISVGAGSSTLSLAQCQWRVLFFDPYATLP